MLLSKKTKLLFSLLSFLTITLFAGEKQFIPDEEFVYKTIDTVSLEMHVFYPEKHSKKKSKAPVMVLFFPGGWANWNPKRMFPQCERFAAEGIVAIAADYRVRKQHKTSPKEAVQDAKSAIRWVREHAEELGVDPDRIIACGASSGGHIAAAAGTATKIDEETPSNTSCIPNAMVLFNPVYNNRPEDGYGYRTVKDYWKDISPMYNITKDTPPAIVMFGSNDSTTPMSVAKEFQSIMKEKGILSDLVIYPNEKHGYFNYGKKDHKGAVNVGFETTMKDSIEFLKKLGYIR